MDAEFGRGRPTCRNTVPRLLYFPEREKKKDGHTYLAPLREQTYSRPTGGLHGQAETRRPSAVFGASESLTGAHDRWQIERDEGFSLGRRALFFFAAKDG